MAIETQQIHRRLPAAGTNNDPVCRTWKNTHTHQCQLASLSSSLFPPPISSLSTLGDFFDFNYDIFALPASSLLPLVYSLVLVTSVSSRLFSIPLTVFSRFVYVRSSSSTAPNPFHSFYHAVDVAQTTFVLLTSFHAQRSLTPRSSASRCCWPPCATTWTTRHSTTCTK